MIDKSWRSYLATYVNDPFYWFQPKGFTISRRNLFAIQEKLRILERFDGNPWNRNQRAYTRELHRAGLFEPRTVTRGSHDYAAIVRMNKEVFDSLGLAWVKDDSIVKITDAGRNFLGASADELPGIVAGQLSRYMFPNPAVGRDAEHAGIFPYLTLLSVLTHFPSGIPIECYELFVARIRADNEVPSMVEMIKRYLSLDDTARGQILQELHAMPILKDGRLTPGTRRSSLVNTIKLNRSYMVAYLGLPGLVEAANRQLSLCRERHAEAEHLVQSHIRQNTYIRFSTTEDWIAFFGALDRAPTFAEALAYYRRTGEIKEAENAFREARGRRQLPSELQALSDQQFRRLSVLEKTLEDFLEFNLPLLEPGLQFVGRQYPTATGPLDILAKDRRGRWVVIELKRDRAAERVIGQLGRYRAFIIEERAKGDESQVRGFVVAPQPDDRLVQAARGTRPAPIEVFEFEVKGRACRVYPAA